MSRFDPLALPLGGLQLIEASAGTGKTWTIAALYLRLVLQGGPEGKGLAPEQILVVTFTRAATAELRGRIRARLAELAAALEGGPADALCAGLIASLDPAARAEALLRVRAAVSGFDAAAIFTIHGFCQRALAEHALLAGLELGSELVADEADMVQAAFDTAFKHALRDANPAWIAYLVRRGETPDGWKDELSRYLGQPWLDVVAPDAGEVDTVQMEFDAAWAAAQAAWQAGPLDDLRAAVAGGCYNGKLLRADWLESSIRRWQGWLAGPASPEPPEKYEDKAMRRLGALALAEAQKQPLPLPPLFGQLDALLDARARLLPLRRKQLAAAKAAALRAVEAELAQGKHRRGVMSFNDLLLELAAALDGQRGDQLAAALAQRYRAALIDEFQDTDTLQFGVFDRVFVQAATAGTSCIFLVGDPKQAIYSFRGADLYAYLAARERADVRHSLDTNRRSTPPLVTAVGRLFELAPAPFLLDELDYARVEALDDKPALTVDGYAQPALAWQWLAPRGEAAELNKEAGTDAASAVAAEAVAALLALGQAGRARLGECAVAAGDIAVLAASHRQLEAMQAALRARGVASVRIGQDSVFATEEATALLQVLLALAEPSDAHVRAALATHLGGCDAATLLAFDADERAWDAWLSRFRQWHELWPTRGVLAALEGWLLDAGIAARVADWHDGERRLANLLQLFELIGQEARLRLGHAALIGWYRAALAGDGVDAEARLLRLESDAARVRLVTIHASKGLQYPIVFCPFLWDGADGDALLDAAELAEDDSLAIAHEGGRAVLDFGSADRPMRLAQARRERVSEKLRLLYVALTRPESMLCLGWGPVRQAERSALGWLLCRGEQRGGDAAVWQAALDDLLAASPEAMGWLDLPAAQLAAPGALPPPDIHLARLARSLRWQWQMSSFSSLTAGLHDERPDHDAASAEPLLPAVVPRHLLDIAAFPAGARAGVMLHALFETWDFARHDPLALREHCRQQLAAHGFDEAWMDGVARMVETTLATPVTPDGACLQGLAPARKLVELEFTFGLRPFDWRALAAILADPAHGLPPAFAQAAATLDAHVGRGFLKGFMDLACELNGRYWVLDYKSNKLGQSPTDYTAAAVTASMAAEHYYLQALIYCVALHRYLKWRRPGYDYAQHFGGASYLYLRGLDPATPGQGLWAYAPPLGLIEALEGLLCT